MEQIEAKQAGVDGPRQGQVRTRAKTPAAPGEKSSCRRRPGQAMVEFALVLTVALVILLVSIQGAIIADASLAVSQLVFQGVRYAAVNPSFDAPTVTTYVKSIASPVINESSGADLTISLNPTTAPRAFGTSVSMTITYNATSKVILPNPFLGISFPTSLTATETAMSE